MARKPKNRFKEAKWPLATLVLSFLCLLLVIVILVSGGGLADRAFQEGRRFSIDLHSGAIIGQTISTTTPEEIVETPQELPADISGEEYGPQMNGALPGNFVGGKLESQQPVETPPPAPEKPKAEYEYPLAVQQEPETRQVAVAAPVAPEIKVRELEAAKPGKALPIAPDDGLVEKTPQGDLPKIGEDGERPWQVYGKPFTAEEEEPLIAVIITGLGASKPVTELALKMEEHFTFSFSPYGAESDMWARTARSTGHEVMLDIPMQLADYPASDPGPQGLLILIKPEENLSRLHGIMGRMQGYTGLLMPMTSAIPDAVIKHCFADIAKRGLLLVKPPTTNAAAAKADQEANEQMGLTAFRTSLVIDAKPEEASIQAQLAELVKKAKKKGMAIGVAHPYPLTLEILQRWQKELAGQGVRLAPLSALAARED